MSKPAESIDVSQSITDATATFRCWSCRCVTSFRGSKRALDYFNEVRDRSRKDTRTLVCGNSNCNARNEITLSEAEWDSLS
jgi:hypothetical protein